MNSHSFFFNSTVKYGHRNSVATTRTHIQYNVIPVQGFYQNTETKFCMTNANLSWVLGRKHPLKTSVKTQPKTVVVYQVNGSFEQCST